MNYYTSAIPLPLVEKLKEKGMPAARRYLMRGLIARITPTPIEEIPNYGGCFEWLDENGIAVGVRELRRRKNPFWGYVWKKYSLNEELPLRELQSSYFFCNTWHEAAIAAIEKALTLI